MSTANGLFALSAKVGQLSKDFESDFSKTLGSLLVSKYTCPNGMAEVDVGLVFVGNSNLLQEFFGVFHKITPDLSELLSAP